MKLSLIIMGSPNLKSKTDLVQVPRKQCILNNIKFDAVVNIKVHISSKCVHIVLVQTLKMMTKKMYSVQRPQLPRDACVE